MIVSWLLITEKNIFKQKKIKGFLDHISIVAVQNDQIGPNFSEEQFIRKLRQDSRAAMQRKCKKVSGDENAYNEAQDAKRQAKRCIRSWIQTEGLETDFQVAKLNHNIKPLLKKWVFRRDLALFFRMSIQKRFIFLFEGFAKNVVA